MNDVLTGQPDVRSPFDLTDGEQIFFDRFERIHAALKAIRQTRRADIEGDMGAIEMPVTRIGEFEAIKAMLAELGCTITLTGDQIWTADLMIQGEVDINGKPARLAFEVSAWRCPESGEMIGSLYYERHMI